MWWNILVLIILSAIMKTSVWCCPSEVCICKWKGGKQTVECGGRALSRIPDGMDPGTQVLNFSGNSLTILQSERFKKMELINLQKIYLARNQLIKIHDRAFKGLTNLVELDLSENMLTTIPTDTFQDYSSLMRLSLSGNPIRMLKTSAFKHLSYLTTLELSNCQIETIEDEAFIGMDNLEWLRLDGNRISTIKGGHVLPESLHGINLQSNRWQCDCKLIDVHTWLNSFNVPQREEPKCSGPLRLAGSSIKSLQVDDLACLPDITPTTVYLEIAEGRNISLICKITAIPEATISWWFQGQILQNDTLLAPNLHLYYYIEDGIDEKRSELFIFNTNTEDNGTFSCVAENSAGRTQANYTIRVIVKEEPIVEQVTLTHEYFLIIIAGSSCLGFLVFIVICILMCKCRRRNINQNKKNRSKNGGSSMQNNQKCASITNDIGEPLTCSKLNGTVNLSESNQQDVVLYLNATNNSDKNGMNNMTPMSQYCSPPSTRSYQDQNPDLINDAESGNKVRSRQDTMESDLGEKDSDEHGSIQDCNSESSFSQAFMQPHMIRPMGPRFSAMSTLPRGMTRDMYQHQVDIHLSPGCFLDQNGYPVEYGLQNVPMIGQAPVNYYRTLPHNRGQKAGNKVRYSNDAEFITRTSQTFQTYGPDDVRYTAAGYPQPNDDGNQFPSPPEGYKGDLTMKPVAYVNSPAFCVSPLPQQWPSFLPGYHPQLIPMPAQGNQEFKRFIPPQPGQTTPTTVTKKCVGAQTNDMDKNTIHEQEEEEDEEEAEQNESKLRHLSGPLADSPDEGYVGDSQESTDI